jgi:hypothetical protein
LGRASFVLVRHLSSWPRISDLCESRLVVAIFCTLPRWQKMTLSFKDEKDTLIKFKFVCVLESNLVRMICILVNIICAKTI